MPISSPGPWVDYELQDPRPWASNHGIVKFIEFPVRIPAMSHRAFHLYWMHHHSPHVMNVTAFSQYMRKYSTNHVYPSKVPGLPEHYLQTTQFEGASEVWINSLDEMGAWLSQPLYAELIQPDEPRFLLQNGSGELIIAREERLYERQADLHEGGLTKVYVLMRRREAVDYDAFHAAVSEYGQRTLQQAELRDFLYKFVINHRLREPWPEGMVLADIDAVIELWFDSPARVACFYQHPRYLLDIAPREELFADKRSIRALVTRVCVIHDEYSFQRTTTQPLAFSWDCYLRLTCQG